MEPTSFLGQKIMHVLSSLKETEEIVAYSKVEGDEFLKFPEKGFYLHSKDGNEVIFDCRIYLEEAEGFLPSSGKIRGKFSSVKTIRDLEKMLGGARRDIRSVRIPSRPPTLPGKEFSDEDLTIKAFYNDDEVISYLHVCLSTRAA